MHTRTFIMYLSNECMHVCLSYPPICGTGGGGHGTFTRPNSFLCVEWASICTALTPEFNYDTLSCVLKTVLFSSAGAGSTTE